MADEESIKAGILEMVGVSMNSSHLQSKASSYEMPIDRIAGMGAAALSMRLGVDLCDLPIAAAPSLVYGADLDVRDVLSGELAPVLAHIRFGGQYGQVPTAIRLFAAWLVHRPLFAAIAASEHDKLRTDFATRALQEWLSDRCTACRGSGKQQKSQGGQWITPQGRGQRNAIFRTCSVCNGTRRAPSSPPQRMKALGLDRERYDAERWDQKFSAAFAWLNGTLRSRLQRALTAELGRRKRRI